MISLRLVDRDAHRDLAEQIRVNAGDRVPVALFSPRISSLVRGSATVRSTATAPCRRRLGPSCPTGLFTPDRSDLDQTLQDWLDEFERVQLMLRLSGRLRQKHGD